MKRLKQNIEKFYYSHFTEDLYDVNYEGTIHEDRMYQSMFSVIILRMLIAIVALYFIAEVFYPDNMYDFWQFCVAVFIGYLVSPWVVFLLPKAFVFIPKERRLKFIKGAYIPVPLTLVWLVPKFL